VPPDPQRLAGHQADPIFERDRIDLQEVFELHGSGRTEVVYERRQLEDINSAIREVEAGQVKDRLVFDLQ
jgi:D-arabinose 1-dehydrogenase-like Zn-dependent alcohol dehydrogenase